MGNLSVYIYGKVVCSKTYLRGAVLKMPLLYFGEERDGIPHDDTINFFKKSYEKVFKNVKFIFWDKSNLLEQFCYFG